MLGNVYLVLWRRLKMKGVLKEASLNSETIRSTQSLQVEQGLVGYLFGRDVRASQRHCFRHSDPSILTPSDHS